MVTAALTSNSTLAYESYRTSFLRSEEQNEERLSERQDANSQAPTPQMSARLMAQYQAVDSLQLTYANDDGDMVSLSMDYASYQQTTISATLNADTANSWNDIANFIKDEYKRLNGELLDSIMNGLNGEKAAKPQKKVEETKPVAITGLAEEWNAENTSQRIVDFATSFFDAFEGSGDAYNSMIRDAISEGFKQAKEILGDIPGEVGQLIDDTFDLVTKKLDTWAEEKGITVEQKVTEETMAV